MATASLWAEALLPAPIGSSGEWKPSGPPALVYSVASSRGLPVLLYAASMGGIYRSSDLGGNWILVNSQFFDLQALNDIQVDPISPNVLYGSRGYLGEVFKSVDGGVNWSPAGARLPTGFWRIKIDPANHLRLYAGGDRGIYVSNDGGETWAPLLTDIFNVAAITIDPGDSRRLYAIGDVAGHPGSFFASSDRGATWSRNYIDAGEPKSALAIDPADPSTLYVPAYCCRSLWKSSDFGRNWFRPQAPTTELEDLVTDPTGVVYLAGSHGPTPGGPPPPGEPTGVFRSEDGGTTWSDISRGLGGNAISRLFIVSDGSLLVALPASTTGTFVLVTQTQAAEIPALSLKATFFFILLLVVSGLLLLRGPGLRP